MVSGNLVFIKVLSDSIKTAICMFQGITINIMYWVLFLDAAEKGQK